jgi:hypothetical protein
VQSLWVEAQPWWESNRTATFLRIISNLFALTGVADGCSNKETQLIVGKSTFFQPVAKVYINLPQMGGFPVTSGIA